LDEREWTEGVHALPVELAKAGTAQQIGRLLDGARTFALAEERRGSQPAREEVDNHQPSAMTSDSGTLEQAGLLVAPVIKRRLCATMPAAGSTPTSSIAFGAWAAS
jgi:hypothetical protein